MEIFMEFRQTQKNIINDKARKILWINIQEFVKLFCGWKYVDPGKLGSKCQNLAGVKIATYYSQFSLDHLFLEFPNLHTNFASKKVKNPFFQYFDQIVPKLYQFNLLTFIKSPNLMTGFMAQKNHIYPSNHNSV